MHMLQHFCGKMNFSQSNYRGRVNTLSCTHLYIVDRFKKKLIFLLLGPILSL